MKRKPFPVTTLGEMRFAVSPQERVDANAGIIAAAIVGAARSEIYARSTADCRAVEVVGASYALARALERERARWRLDDGRGRGSINPKRSEA